MNYDELLEKEYEQEKEKEKAYEKSFENYLVEEYEKRLTYRLW